MEVIGKGGFPKVIGLYRGHIGVIFYGSYIVFRVPKIIGTILEVPIIRTIGGPPILGNYKTCIYGRKTSNQQKLCLVSTRRGKATGSIWPRGGSSWTRPAKHGEASSLDIHNACIRICGAETNGPRPLYIGDVKS